jgi:hypothetical protein
MKTPISKYKIIWIIIFVLIFIPYIYQVTLSYKRISEQNDLFYGPYNECKRCISTGESSYSCALKVVDNKSYNFVGSEERKKSDELIIQSRIENLIKKCSTESPETLTQDIYLYISKERGRDNPTIDEVKEACQNPKFVITEKHNREMADSICHISALEDNQGKPIAQDGKATTLYKASIEPISRFIIYSYIYIKGIINYISAKI